MKMLTLRSSDNEEFEISESTAALSITINNMVEDGCVGDGPIPVPNVDSGTLAKVIEYLKKHGEGDFSDEEKWKFGEEFLYEATLGNLFDLVMAANYLNIKALVDLVCQKIADIIQNKSVESVRETFGVENDYKPEEEEEIKKEFSWAWEGIDEDED